MAGFLTFAITIALIVWSEVKKNKKRDEEYRRKHGQQAPYAPSQSASKTTRSNSASTYRTSKDSTKDVANERKRQAKQAKSKLKMELEKAAREFTSGAEPARNPYGTSTAEKTTPTKREPNVYHQANPVTETYSSTSTTGNTSADDNSIYQSMMQTRADDEANKQLEIAHQMAANPKEQNLGDYDSVVGSSNLMDEINDIIVCGYHPKGQRDFVAEGQEMLARIS